MSIKVVITDDHHLIVSALEQVISTTPHIRVCGVFRSGAELAEGLKTTSPDILMLDYHLPDDNGGHLARYVNRCYPNIKILALTGMDKPGMAAEMLACGCHGYLLKSSADAGLIIEALESVYAGRVFIDKMASIKKEEFDHFQEGPYTFTNRELEVLKGIAEEMSSQQIAEKLFISKRTVDSHRASLMIKSGAKNTAGLIKFAIKLELV